MSPRVVLLLSSATSVATAAGHQCPAGYGSAELVAVLEQFAESDVAVTVATPDGRVPLPDPAFDVPYLAMPDADFDFMRLIAAGFREQPNHVRLTWIQRTTLGLEHCRALFDGLLASGLRRADAHTTTSRLATTAWTSGTPLLDVARHDQAVAGQLGGLLDALSAESADRSARHLSDLRARASEAVSAPVRVTECDLTTVDAVFALGGYGALTDFATAEIGRLFAMAHERGLAIGATSHGQAALLNAGHRRTGTWIFDGYLLTAMTQDEDEQLWGSASESPMSIENTLKNLGGVFDSPRRPWEPHVVTDRGLVTGQNPGSAASVAAQLIENLERA